MTVRERILMIKLLKKKEKLPEYISRIGVKASMLTNLPEATRGKNV